MSELYGPNYTFHLLTTLSFSSFLLPSHPLFLLLPRSLFPSFPPSLPPPCLHTSFVPSFILSFFTPFFPSFISLLFFFILFWEEEHLYSESCLKQYLIVSKEPLRHIYSESRLVICNAG